MPENNLQHSISVSALSISRCVPTGQCPVACAVVVPILWSSCNLKSSCLMTLPILTRMSINNKMRLHLQDQIKPNENFTAFRCFWYHHLWIKLGGGHLGPWSQKPKVAACPLLTRKENLRFLSVTILKCYPDIFAEWNAGNPRRNPEIVVGGNL